MPDDIAPINPTDAPRKQIVSTALNLFSDQGYVRTEMGDIAEAAGLSLDQLESYFLRKELIVLSYYEQLMHEMREQMASLPFDTIAIRLCTVLRSYLEQASGQRSALAGLFATSLQEEEGEITERLAALRTAMIADFQTLVRESVDSPRDNMVDSLGALLATTQILVTLFWLYDRTPGQRATHKLIEYIDDGLGLLRPLMLMPLVNKAINRIATLLLTFFTNQVLDESSSD
ncbi:MAG: TetR/AcrR family transcriptional regulator [Anaerolineae bacterium]|nr:TetR/AcrR family transcriptional regulator [Anaerolineae bacterium]MCA9888491.1 TetR/AcrR family transcriptional regulator [Anaerolineae bacterium]